MSLRYLPDLQLGHISILLEGHINPCTQIDNQQLLNVSGKDEQLN